MASTLGTVLLLHSDHSQLSAESCHVLRTFIEFTELSRGSLDAQGGSSLNWHVTRDLIQVCSWHDCCLAPEAHCSCEGDDQAALLQAGDLQPTCTPVVSACCHQASCYINASQEDTLYVWTNNAFIVLQTCTLRPLVSFLSHIGSLHASCGHPSTAEPAL